MHALLRLLVVLSCLWPEGRVWAGETHWTSRQGSVRGTGNAEIKAPGVLALSTHRAEVTEIAREPDVPAQYVLSFRARVALFGSEQGTAVYDGRHRLMLYFKPQGLAVRDETELVKIVFAWDSDTRFHDYTLVVRNGRADLIVDHVYETSFDLPRHAGKDRVVHWVKGPSPASLWVDRTSLDPHATYSFDEDWNDLGQITHEGPGTVEARASSLVLSASEDAVTRAVSYRDVGPEYIATFAQQVLAFGDEVGFAIHDGGYRAIFFFRREGLEVRQADGSTVWLAGFSDDASRYARHQYVLTTRRDHTAGKERGKARLLIDGTFAGEWNLEPDRSEPRIEHWVGPNAAAVAIDFTKVRAYREPEFAFSDNFESEALGTTASYWMLTTAYDRVTPKPWKVTNTSSSGLAFESSREKRSSLALLHVFAKNVTRFSGKFFVAESGAEGALWFNVRRNSEQARLTVRASLATGRFELIEREAENLEKRVLSTHDGPKLTRGFHTFEFSAWGPLSTFVLDGRTILASTRVKHQNYGRIGFQTRDARVLFDDVVYEGDAPVERGVLEGVRVKVGERMPMHSASTGLLRRADGSLWLTNTQGTCFISHDRGATFRYEEQLGCGTNLFELPGTRELFRVVTNPKPDGTGYELFVEQSPTGLKCALEGMIDPTCWELRRRRLEGMRTTGKLMPGKVTQASTGRVFVAVPEPNPESIGGLHVYYSDDLFTFMPAMTAHNMETHGVSVGAGKVIEAFDGSVKLFMRSNLGTLLESTSYDAGHTWTAPSRTVFRSPRADFNIHRDPVSGFHYMAWQYDDPDETRSTGPDGTLGAIASRGRARIGLAVSRDGTKTWRFLLTVDDWEGHAFRHMNTSILAYDQTVWIASARRSYNGRDFSPDIHDLALFRIDTRQIHEQVLFPGTH